MTDVTKITARTGQEFNIDLQARPQGGYMWEYVQPIQPLNQVVKNIGQSIEPLPGMAGCIQRFEFVSTAVKNDVAMLQFVYKRSWEDKPLQSRTFQITVQPH